MSTVWAATPQMSPAMTRMAAISPSLDDAALTALRYAEQSERRIPVRRELVAEGAPVDAPILLLSGWAASVRLLADGRRQIMGFLLPGELLGSCGRPRSRALATVVALTDVTVAALPRPETLPAGSPLADAYATSRALDDLFLLNQVARLGRLDAYERLVDLLIELHDRFALAGMAIAGSFPLPLTQETLADALGLTSVHVNRMIQLMRKDGLLTWKSSTATLVDQPRLGRLVDPRLSRSLLDDLAGRRPTR